MFYVEKNDKPNWFEKKLNLIKVKENTIVLPITDDCKEKSIEKIATKTNKIIRKYSNSKKVVLSKEMYKEDFCCVKFSIIFLLFFFLVTYKIVS